MAMNMDDIKKYVEDAVKKITSDEKTMKEFKANAEGTIKKVLPMVKDNEQVKKIAEAVQAKIDLDKLGGVGNALKGILGK